jgi:hypothetical protein
MNTPTPRETVARLRRSLRRQAALGWALGGLVALSGVSLAVSPSLWFGSARTEGTVAKLEPEVEFIGHGSPQAGDMVWYEEAVAYYPVVEYQVGDRKYTYRPRSSFRTYDVGQKVPVAYKVGRPGVARIDTFADCWLVPLLLGGVLLVLGVMIIACAALSGSWMLQQLEAIPIGGSRSVEGHGESGQTASSSA